MMNIQEMYSKADKLSKEKKYDAALKILDKIKIVAPNYYKAYFLEASIWHKRDNDIKEYYALKKILPLLDFSSPEGKEFAMKVLALIAKNYSVLSLNEKSLQSYRSSIELAGNKKVPFALITNAYFSANISRNFSPDDARAFQDEFKKFYEDIKPYPKKFYEHEKIRVGFISGDFHLHPVMNWSWPLVTRLDKNLFETYCYSNDRTRDKINKYLRTSIHNWRNIYPLTDEAAAKLIRDDEIDILFDLSGHTKGHRIGVSVYHPASVQVVGVGDMFSSGMKCFDYFLSDVYCAGNAEAMSKYFNEKIIKLPHSHICYEPTSSLGAVKDAPCLKKGYVTFGCFNQFHKLNDFILGAWKRILDAVPNSRLILKNKICGIDGGKEFVSKRLKNLGFDLARVEMRPFSEIYLTEYGDVDIALDTFPYTGGVTTCEALFMGVPVVSLYGDRHGTRFGLSILNNIGIGELAVASYDEYVGRAVMLASDWELLAILRKNLRVMMKKSPLMDSAGYIREVGQAFIDVLDIERSRQ